MHFSDKRNYFEQNLKRLDKHFYLQETEKIAKNLLGKLFVKTEVDGKILAAEIHETEAYLHEIDESSHSFRGLTKRNSPMFSAGGILYVYFIYGNHFCANIVTENEGIGAAVLIRAAKPIEGIELMKERRNFSDLENLCKGPGNFAKAFGIQKDDNFQTLFFENNSDLKNNSIPSIDAELERNFCNQKYSLFEYNHYNEDEICTSQRIGITKSTNLNLRFFLKNSKFISGKKSCN